MRWVNFDLLSGFGVDPPVGHAAAREYERVLAVAVDDGQFKIAVEWRRRYGFPHPDSSMTLERLAT